MIFFSPGLSLVLASFPLSFRFNVTSLTSWVMFFLLRLDVQRSEVMFLWWLLMMPLHPFTGGPTCLFVVVVYFSFFLFVHFFFFIKKHELTDCLDPRGLRWYDEKDTIFFVVALYLFLFLQPELVIFLSLCLGLYFWIWPTVTKVIIEKPQQTLQWYVSGYIYFVLLSLSCR